MQKSLQRLLRDPRIYGWLQLGISRVGDRHVFVDDYVRPSSGDRVLDVGCGPGSLVRYLPDVDYVGFDPNPAYIEAARRDYGDRGEFVVAGIDDFDCDRQFDLVIAKAVLHHLDDRQVAIVAGIASRVLRPGGRFVSLDPALVDGQHPIARFLIRRDRGDHVRSPEAYRDLIMEHLSRVEVQLRTDLMRVPYTHAIIVAAQ